MVSQHSASNIWFPAVTVNSSAAGKHESSSGNRGIEAEEDGKSSAPKVNFKEKTISAAGAAFLSAVIVNPLDVAKTRLQAQAAGVQYQNHITDSLQHQVLDGKCPPVCPRGGPAEVPQCPPDCFRYKGTWDVFYKVVRQEGFLRLWRGTDAALAIAVPTVGIYLPVYDVFHEWLEDVSKRNALHIEPYTPLIAGTVARSLACIVCGPIELARTRMQAHKEVRQGVSPPGMWATMSGASERPGGSLQRVRGLWTGVGAQLARDVPFSAICWSILEPIRKSVRQRLGSDSALSVLTANVCGGFLAGSIAAAATCPLDVVKTRRQILVNVGSSSLVGILPSSLATVKDPSKRMDSNTAKVLMTIWRDEGLRGLFSGVGPRVARAGPSVSIVVSFYEVMKLFIHHTGSDERH
ncbi:mitochondrial carrier protein MTM1 [Selaginella moellendorffii]|uniref:mitochondrial carrier protein MTM1 n=1 Tax=Selaginella moellendorffii TaxID=88036 RepID=UPI000D1CA957|nr:mitochondrial carrier protein MTM1 [Selaginella moellendorffii]|eukprot:XP_024540324.1 mitochondrial carrier protein MTM1 [Selaginella moellendorffii]